jgi:alpha-beta hydrolase superfamily lysophospholipase
MRTHTRVQYDVAACLAYVAASTHSPDVAYVSHSQGGTLLLAALSRHPELVPALGRAVLMAPVASTRHASSVPLQALAAVGTDGVRPHLCSSAEDLGFITGQVG